MKTRAVVLTLMLVAGRAAGLSAQTPTDSVAIAEAAVEERPSVVPGSCQAPVYPILLRNARMEGRVILQFVIGTDGRVEPSSIRTLRSTHQYFDEAARRALVTCRYRPGRFNSQPVRVVVQTPFEFQLRRS